MSVWWSICRWVQVPTASRKEHRSLGGGIGSGCGLPGVGSENLIQVLVRTMCALNYRALYPVPIFKVSKSQLKIVYTHRVYCRDCIISNVFPGSSRLMLWGLLIWVNLWIPGRKDVLAFCHGQNTSVKQLRKYKILFWLTILEVSACGWLIPFLLGLWEHSASEQECVIEEACSLYGSLETESKTGNGHGPKIKGKLPVTCPLLQ